MENRVNQIAQFLKNNAQGRLAIGEALKMGLNMAQGNGFCDHAAVREFFMGTFSRAFEIAENLSPVYGELAKEGILDEVLYQESLAILANKAKFMGLAQEKLAKVSTDLNLEDYVNACGESLNEIREKEDLGYSDEMIQLNQDVRHATGIALKELGETGGLYELAVEAGLGEDAELFKVAA